MDVNSEIPIPPPGRAPWWARAGCRWGAGPAQIAQSARALAACAALATLAVAGASSSAQPSGEAFFDDSPLARDTIAGLEGLRGRGSVDEAARAVQRLLDEQGETVIEPPTGAGPLVSVRALLHQILLADAQRLEEYRRFASAQAERMLASGDAAGVERTRLLTDAGLEAALRLAQQRLEEGRFEAARLILEQLEEHPARRSGPLGPVAASMLREVGGYLAAARSSAEAPGDAGARAEDVVARAARWAAESAGAATGEPAGGEPAGGELAGGAAWPALPAALAAGASVSVLREGGELRFGSLLPRPAGVSPVGSSGGDGPAEPARRGAGGPRFGVFSEFLPLADASRVYVQSDEAVVALDRLTMRGVWRWPPETESGPGDGWGAGNAGAAERGVPANLRGQATGPASLSAELWAGVVVTALTPVGSGPGASDIVTALRGDDGRVLWRTPLALIDPRLEDGLVDGPPLVHEGVVLVRVRAATRTRRQVAVLLVGLDAGDGRALWVRPIASVGTLPYEPARTTPDGLCAHRGVVYLTDSVGVLAAVEASSGRPVWVSRVAAAPEAREAGQGWEVCRPVAWGDSLALLTPDRTKVAVVDAASGAVRSSRSAEEFGGPSYLLRAGETLVAVSTDRVASVPLGQVAGGPVTLSPRFGQGITGRAVVAGEMLLVPTMGGVLSVSAASPLEPTVAAPATGTSLPLDGQVVGFIGSGLASYVDWEAVSGRLAEREAASPADPEPATQFAEVAFRLGLVGEVSAAVDRATAAIAARRRSGESFEAGRARLFAALREMLESGRQGWGGRSGPATAPGVLDESSYTRLTGRLGELADSAEERVAHLLILGELHEALGRPSEALDAYQRVLTDRSLASAAWRQADRTARAEVEATARVRGLVESFGGGVYEPFDVEAQTRLSALPTGASAARLESIARGYPLAFAAVEAWRRTGEAHTRAGEPHAAVRALHAAMSSAERAHALRGALPASAEESVARAAGELITALRERGRLDEAEAAVTRLARTFPEISPRVSGEAREAAAVLAEIRAALAGVRRLPRVGDVRAEAAPRLFGGYVLQPLTPVADVAGVAPEPLAGALLMSPSEARLRWLRAEAGALSVGWERSVTAEPQLLRRDDASAWLYWPAADGGRVERIDLASGESIWQTASWPGLVWGGTEGSAARVTPGGAAAGGVGGVAGAGRTAGGSRRVQLLTTMGRQTLAMVDKSGAGVLLDPATGEARFRGATGLDLVTDVFVGEGVVALSGLRTGPDGRRRQSVLVLDSDDGAVLQTVEDLPAQVNWVRVLASGELLCGTTVGVTSIDLSSGQRNWEATLPNGGGAEEAWAVGDLLAVRSGQVDVWLIHLPTGRQQAVAAGDRLRTPGVIRAVWTGDRLAMASGQGLAVFDAEGNPAGLDALDISTSNRRLLPAAFAEGRAVVLERDGRPVAPGEPRDRLHVLETASGRLAQSLPLRLLGEPVSVDVIDGFVLISAGEAVMALAAPLVQ